MVITVTIHAITFHMPMSVYMNMYMFMNIPRYIKRKDPYLLVTGSPVITPHVCMASQRPVYTIMYLDCFHF